MGKKWHRAGVLALGVLLSLAKTASAATIASPTYDNDTYMFVGTNNESDPTLSITEDYSAGIVAQNNAHFVFGVVKFGNLAGLSTKATGGGEKYLQLTTTNFPGPATIGVSIALADIEANDQTGYPSPLFAGNRFGLNTDRLRWYMNNIKGDDPAYGGYAGGAPHLGVIDFNAPGDFFLNVTDAVDAWISGARPNHGLGLWGIRVSGEQGNTFDLASANHASAIGPVLVNSLPGSTPLPGDANSDGRVDRRDMASLAAGYGQLSGAQWSDGDFNDDGRVSLADVGILQQNFSGATAVAIPEPGCLSLFVSLSLVAASATGLRRAVYRPAMSSRCTSVGRILHS